MTTIKYVLFFNCLVCSLYAGAQQLPQFTQYVYNTMSINPAYAGSRETLNVTGLHRNQWAGIEGNPTTSTFSIHTPIKFSDVGVGLSYINDNLGFEKTNYIYADISYTVRLNRKVNLALGIKGGASNYRLETPDSSDPFFSGGFTEWSPNVGAGLYLNTNQWYVGVSSPRLLNNVNNG